jgi:hypothetical protein
VLQRVATQDPAPKSGHRQRVLVLYEPGARGERALTRAARMVDRDGAELTVVAIAPQDSTACCGFGIAVYNEVVRDEAGAELDEARGLLGAAASGAVFNVLVGDSDPPFRSWVARQAFDVVLLPARRRVLRRRPSPSAAALRRASGADVRVINESRPRERDTLSALGPR